MSTMDPCPQCGGKLKATLAPLWGWKCPACLMLFLPKDSGELTTEELRALLPHYAQIDDRLEETLVRVKELEEGFTAKAKQCDIFFARLQELEPAAEEIELLREALQKQVDYGVQLLARIQEFEKQRSAMEKDSARLDWLEENEGAEWAIDWGLDLWSDEGGSTLRQAVDKKMEKP